MPSETGGLAEFLKVNAKAVVTFVVIAVLNAINDVASGKVPFPQTLGDWGRYLGTSLLGAVIVWATGNKLTEKQIVKEAVKQGITVATNSTIDTAAAVAEKAVHEATAVLPDVPARQVNQVAEQVSNTVTDFLKGVSSNFPDRLIPTK